jgi:4-hydroxy-3-methylbut-2-enyl diphosphate reductase
VKIVVAKHMGFCGGVKRAVEMARSTADQSSGPVFTWGPLIHNPQVVRQLEEAGVRVASSPEDLQGEAFVVSAYGVERVVLDIARTRGMRIVDATCPVVIRAHTLALKLVEEGYDVIAVGDHGHPEMVTLKEALGDRVTIVHTLEEARQVKVGPRIGVISQTTQSQENFQRIVADLVVRTKEVKVINTLCPAITVRQVEANRLVREVDALVVIGGHQSSNTTRLSEIGRANGIPTYHVEVADELKEEWFEGVETVGVTSGASTPDWIIAEVLARLEEFSRKKELSQARP